MAKTDRLRLKDVRDAFRLLGECRELGADSHAWRMHMLYGLRCLTGTQLALYMHIQHLGTAEEALTEPLAAGFMEARDRALWVRYQQEKAHLDDPFHQRYYARFSGALRTRNLESVVDRREWEASRHYNEYIRACRLDDRITSSVLLAPAAGASVQVIVLHRSAEDGKYSRRFVRLMHLFHNELTPMLGRHLALPGVSAFEPLPPQLQRVLACVLQGENEKRIAARLELSRHTVNRHLQRLYRRFGAHSRSELMFHCRDMLEELRATISED